MDTSPMLKKIQPYLVIVFSYCVLYGWNLGVPAVEYYDENYFVPKARSMLERDLATSIHPPFGKMLISLSTLVLGDHPWAWRLFPFLAGLGSLLLLYFLAKKIFQNSRVAFFSAILFGFDCISFTMGRIAILDSMMLFFSLAAISCISLYALDGQWPRRKALLLCGFFMGLALATRWVSLTTFFVLAAFWPKFLKPNEKKTSIVWEGILAIVVALFVYIGVLILYSIVKGHDFTWWFQYQKSAIQYHMELTQKHGYASEWWGWPFLVKPIWFYFTHEPNPLLQTQRISNGILCIGNPLIFWLIPLAMGYVLWKFWKERSWVSGFVLAGFLSQWLPWAFVHRLKFFHYFYTAMPFVALALAMGLEELWQRRRWGKVIVTTYLVLVVLMFAYWYPLLTGMTISEKFFHQHMWFRSWI